MPGFSNALQEYKRGIAQGRGQGRYSQYKPWLFVRSVKSCAVRSRIPSNKFGRVMHFMSNAEVLTFLQLEWNDDVVEIREQFPLHPEVTNQIAQELCVLPAGYSRGGIVMTTDFLVTYKRPDGASTFRAYQVKATHKDADQPRTNTKLVIEQHYWRRRSVPCTVIVSEDFNRTYCANLRTFFPERNQPYSIDELQSLSRHLQPLRLRQPDCNVRDLQCMSPVLLNSGFSVTALRALKILIAHKVWRFSDIQSREFLRCRLEDFEVGHVC